MRLRFWQQGINRSSRDVLPVLSGEDGGTYTIPGPGFVGVDTDNAFGVTQYTVTLPPADSMSGERIVIQDVGGSAGTRNIEVLPNGTDEIEQSSTVTLESDQGMVELIAGPTVTGASPGAYPLTSWWVVSSKGTLTFT